ncbi:MAG TPA: hypothetical protein VD713_01650, partial [Sphingomonadales bacterium]|nr:hypothetical protein [Sphingomonadales bacterium]
GRTKGERVVFDHLGSLAELKKQVPVADSHIFRLYDPQTLTFYYRGDGFKLQGLADAISNIYSKISLVHRQMFPDHYLAGASAEAAGGTPPPAKKVN